MGHVYLGRSPAPGRSGPTLSKAAEARGPLPAETCRGVFAAPGGGARPFGHGEAAGVSNRAVHEDIDVAGPDSHLAELIRACVAKDPGARPGLQEIVARCSVRSALAEDPTCAALVDLAEPTPRAPSAPGFGPAAAFTQTSLPPVSSPPGRTPTARGEAEGIRERDLYGVHLEVEESLGGSARHSASSAPANAWSGGAAYPTTTPSWAGPTASGWR